MRSHPAAPPVLWPAPLPQHPAANRRTSRTYKCIPNQPNGKQATEIGSGSVSISDSKDSCGSVIDENAALEDIPADKCMEPLRLKQFAGRHGHIVDYQSLMRSIGYQDADIIRIRINGRLPCAGSQHRGATGWL